MSGEIFRKKKLADSENPRFEVFEVLPIVGLALTPMQFLWCLYILIYILIGMLISKTHGVEF